MEVRAFGLMIIGYLYTFRIQVDHNLPSNNIGFHVMSPHIFQCERQGGCLRVSCTNSNRNYTGLVKLRGFRSFASSNHLGDIDGWVR